MVEHHLAKVNVVSSSLITRSSKDLVSTKSFFLFAQQSWQTRPIERNRGRPDQGEVNSIRKCVTGNCEV